MRARWVDDSSIGRHQPRRLIEIVVREGDLALEAAKDGFTGGWYGGQSEIAIAGHDDHFLAGKGCLADLREVAQERADVRFHGFNLSDDLSDVEERDEF